MKEPTLEEVNESWQQSIRSGRYYNRGIKSRKFSGELPSPLELATLAAALARASQESQETLCSAALNLWITAQETISLQVQCNQDYEKLNAKIEAGRIHLPPFTGPMSRDEFIRKMLPNLTGKTFDQAKFYKKFLKEWIADNHWIRNGDPQTPVSNFLPTQDEVNKLYAEHGIGKFFDSTNYLRFSTFFANWYHDYNARQVSAARRNAAKTSWKETSKRKKNRRAARPLRAELNKIVREIKSDD